MNSSAINKSDGRKSIAVVTWFDSGTVGYLDFKYRVSAIQKNFQYVVIGNKPETQTHLNIASDKFILFHTTGNSLRDRLNYFKQVARVCKKSQYEKVLLLQSSLAHLLYFLPKCDTYLYWNEHPTHIYPALTRGYLWWLKNLKNKLLRKLLYNGAKKASLVMPIGEHHQADLIQHGCQKSNVQLIYMGVDESFLKKNEYYSNQTTEHLRLIYTGSIHIDRGRDLMLHALAEAIEKGAEAYLTYVGADEEQQAYCDMLAKKLGITRYVTIVGRVPGEQIPKFLHDADVGLCFWADKPYWRYNPPTKLFEYLVAGLPVVASDIRTHSVYIEEGVTGCLCPYNQKALAAIIKKLSCEKSFIEKMKVAAKQDGCIYLWGAVSVDFLNALN